jgi:hypothetical protein
MKWRGRVGGGTLRGPVESRLSSWRASQRAADSITTASDSAERTRLANYLGFGKPGPAPDADAGDGRITLEAIQAILSAPSDPAKVYDD